MLQAFERYWHADQNEPRFVLDLHDPGEGRRHWIAAALALLYHVGVVTAAVHLLPGAFTGREGTRIIPDFRNATPLVAPRLDEFKLTQKEPQRTKPAVEVDIAALMPKPRLVAPRLAPEGRVLPPAGVFQPPAPPKETQPVVEAPKIELPQPGLQDAPIFPGHRLPSAPPPETPKLAFEKVGAPQGVAASPGGAAPQVQLPKTGVEEATRALARSGGRGLVVGDIGAGGTGGVSEGVLQNPAQGRNAGTLELLSDPQGVDFRPYLIQVLATVKRNWLSVFPESARFGARGRTAIQFSINRIGQIPKLVIAVPSGAEALDRAAVAGISASNPFPPLPAEFRGPEIRLQLVFSYNMPR